MRRTLPSRTLWLALALLPLLAPAIRADEKDIERRKQELLLKLRAGRAIDRGVLWLAAQQRKDGTFRLEGKDQQGPLPYPTRRRRFGETALATLTLAHGGFGPDKKEVKKAVSYLRNHYRSYMKGDFWTQASSYSLSILVLALHELYAQEPDDDLAEDRERYGPSIRRDRNPCRYPKWAWEMIRRILDWLLEKRSERGLFRYPGGLDGGGPPPGGPAGPAGGPPGGPGRPGGPPGTPERGPEFYGPEDLSNSQYVLLALWVGTRCGYTIETEVVEAIARRLLAWQESDGREVQRVLDPTPAAERGGERYADATRPKQRRDRARGFGYTPGDAPTGSMTTAGLSSLAVVKAILMESHGLDSELRRVLDQGIWDAIAWLALEFTVDGNPMSRRRGLTRPAPTWHYYYLYGLERAAVIVAKRYLGEHDWYAAGARLLVDAQKKDGAWRPPNAVGGWARGMGPGTEYDMSMLDTCFAILFLKRATPRPRQPILAPPPTTEPDTPPTKDDAE